MKRWLFIVHRYLGLVLCLLMAAWCLSGIVMMYVRYPYFGSAQRLAGLPPLSFERCCRSGDLSADALAAPVSAVRVEMLLDRPVLRWRGENYRVHALDLQSGREIAGVSADEAAGIARQYARNAGRDAAHMGTGEPIQRDQWTVQGNYDADRPLYRFALNDPAGTALYVSSTSGEVVQETRFWQRFWNYPGAVTHWLYPVMLRQHPQAWTQTVVWTSLAGTFLVVTGLWAGVLQWKKRASGRRSPYRGVALWHHLSGLIFGVVSLTWVVSGCVSMNPWGFLGGTDSFDEMTRIAGAPPTLSQALGSVTALAKQPLPNDVRSIESTSFDGHLYLTLKSPARVQRIDAATLAPASIPLADLLAGATRLQPGTLIASAQVLRDDDAYWYSHHDQVQLPVLRVELANEERTRYYLDTFEGRLLYKVDSDARWYRWLFSGLHQWDFSATLRSRPLWDIVVVSLMLGMAALFLTGVWLGVRRVRTDVGTLRSAAERRMS